MTQLPPHGGDDADDALLLERARAGDSDAFGELYRREVEPARRLARVLVGEDGADELVAESFAKVLTQLQAGRGPTDDFRAYLHVTLRNGFRDGLRAPKESPSSDQPWLLDDVLPPVEEIVEDLDRDVAVTALATLPKSWQQVLWHLEVEGRKPADVAGILDMEAGAVSSLAFRAREGLKRAYLDQHFRAATTGQCGWTQSRMSQYVRGDLSPRAQQKVADHLDSCADCAAAFVAVDRVNKKLAAWLFPVVLWGLVEANRGGLLWVAGATGLGAAGGTSAGGTGGSGGTVTGATSNPLVLGAAAAVVAAAVVGGLALALTSGDDDPKGSEGSSADGPVDPGDRDRPPGDRNDRNDRTDAPQSDPPADTDLPVIAPTEVPSDAPTTAAPPPGDPPTDPTGPTSPPPSEPPTSEPPTSEPPTTEPPPIVVVPSAPIVIRIDVCGMGGTIRIGGIAINADNPIVEIGGIRYELRGDGNKGAFSIKATALVGFVIADRATTLFHGHLGISLPCPHRDGTVAQAA